MRERVLDAFVPGCASSCRTTPDLQHRHHHAVEDDGHQDEVVEARILHQLDAVRAREALRRKHAQGLGVVLNGSGLDVAVVFVGGGARLLCARGFKS